MNGPRNAMATLTLAMLMFSQSASAGILNYHRNFGLACAEPGYRPALDVRINSVALADAIRDMTGAVLELTRSEEHWSLSLLQGLDQEAEQQRYTMLIAANKALSGSVEASTRLARVTLLQKEIMSDAAANKLPGRGAEVFSTMAKTTSGLASDDFDTGVNQQLDDYTARLSLVKSSLEKTAQVINRQYSTEHAILSAEHAALSDQIRQSTALTLDVLVYAEKVSAQTVKEVRSTAAAMNITSCGTGQGK